MFPRVGVYSEANGLPKPSYASGYRAGQYCTLIVVEICNLNIVRTWNSG